MQDRKDAKTGIRVIPPVIFLIALVAAYLANWFWPVALLPDTVRYTLGPVLIVASFAVMPSIFGAFKRADTPFDARRMPNALVTEGAFRFSRNPGYVALIVLCIGIAVATDIPWLVFTTAAAAVYVHYVIVLVEEKHLEARFGEQYRQYKSRVRRWI